MSRKDYQLIASVLRDLYLGHDEWQRTLPQVANALGDALVRDNLAFDRTKFLKACGVGDVK